MRIVKIIVSYIALLFFGGNVMADVSSNIQKATFAGGCFWCVEAEFDKVKGVISAVSGYIGGKEKNPTYKQVSKGQTGHIESVEITFDANRISYKQLLDIYWKNIDPHDDFGQFCDKGPQYKSAIFYHDESQKMLAESSKKELEEKFNFDIVTKILKADIFYDAEEYHQNYHIKNPLRYKFYRHSCGRDKRLKEIWKKN